MHKYTLNVVKAQRLPKVNTFGTVDGFIELRLVKDCHKAPLSKKDFDWTPDPATCVWSAKTDVVTDNMDPKFNAEFQTIVPGYHALKLQVILWDSNSPLPDVPIAHHIMDMHKITCGDPGQPPTEHKVKFSKIPKVQAPGDFKKSTLTLNLAYDVQYHD